MLQEKVERLLEEAFEENSSLFLLSLEINPANNHISVVLDGDQGVSVKDCVAISRQIEHNLDREQEDFSLEVSSAGVSQPLKLPRQFRKNTGRKLQVRTPEQVIEGELVRVTEEEITISWKTREPKPVGKGKHTVQKEAVLPYSEIMEAKVMITF